MKCLKRKLIRFMSRLLLKSEGMYAMTWWWKINCLDMNVLKLKVEEPKAFEFVLKMWSLSKLANQLIISLRPIYNFVFTLLFTHQIIINRTYTISMPSFPAMLSTIYIFPSIFMFIYTCWSKLQKSENYFSAALLILDDPFTKLLLYNMIICLATLIYKITIKVFYEEIREN